MTASAGRRILLVLLLAAGLYVRVRGIAFGLPNPLARPDEAFIVAVALGFFSGDYNPHFFEWPSLYFYIVHAVFRGIYAIGRLTGAYSTIADVTASIASNPTWAHLTLRGMSVAAAMGTLVMTHGLGRRLMDPAGGLCATAFLAIAYLHVRDSHFGVLDVPLTFLIVATVSTLVSAWRRGSTARFAAAGVTAGLAASLKYNAAALLAPAFVAALLLAIGRERRAPARAIAALAAFGGACAVCFALGTPYALLDYASFRAGLDAPVARLTEGHGVRIDEVWYRHLTFSLLHGVGLPMLAAAAAGVVAAARRDWRSAALVFSFPIAYFAVIGSGHTAFIRYTTPLVPFLCLAAAWAVWTWVLQSHDRLSRLRAAVAVFLISLPSILTVAAFDQMLRRTDTRQLAADWLRRNVRPGQVLYESGASYARPHYTLPPGALPAQLIEFDANLPAFVDNGGHRVDYPDWIIVAESPLRLYTSVPPALRGVLSSRYSVLQTFEASREPEPESWFDRQDAFFLPYADFSRRIRPGPRLIVYQRTS